MRVCDRCEEELKDGCTLGFDDETFDVCSTCLEKIKNYIRFSGKKSFIDKIFNKWKEVHIMPRKDIKEEKDFKEKEKQTVQIVTENQLLNIKLDKLTELVQPSFDYFQKLKDQPQ